MIVLALDPATSCGFCLVNVVNDTADIFEYGYIDVDTTSNFQGDHCIDLMAKLQLLIDDHGIGHITVEDFFYSKRTATGCTVNQAFRTAIHILARQNDIEYTILNISLWKTFIAGRNRPTKEQKKSWGAAAQKLYIQDALWNYFWIRFPNHSLSLKTGKPVGFRFDIVDVVGQAIYYCCIVNHVPTDNISCSVDVPDDVVLTRSLKKQYVYN